MSYGTVIQLRLHEYKSDDNNVLQQEFDHVAFISAVYFSSCPLYLYFSLQNTLYETHPKQLYESSINISLICNTYRFVYSLARKHTTSVGYFVVESYIILAKSCEVLNSNFKSEFHFN